MRPIARSAGAQISFWSGRRTSARRRAIAANPAGMIGCWRCNAAITPPDAEGSANALSRIYAEREYKTSCLLPFLPAKDRRFFLGSPSGRAGRPRCGLTERAFPAAGGSGATLSGTAYAVPPPPEGEARARGNPSVPVRALGQLPLQGSLFTARRACAVGTNGLRSSQ